MVNSTTTQSLNRAHLTLMCYPFKVCHDLLKLRNTRQHFNVYLGAILNNKIRNKKHKNAKKKKSK